MMSWFSARVVSSRKAISASLKVSKLSAGKALHGVAGQYRLIAAFTLVYTGGELATLLNVQEIHLGASGAMVGASRSAYNVPRLICGKAALEWFLAMAKKVSPNETSCLLVLRRVDDDEAYAHECRRSALPRARTLLMMIIHLPRCLSIRLRDQDVLCAVNK
jgi:hypothetical protein